ncbi:MAG: radical SAM family heme chaperone HemW [Campylobacterota bacterium]|nr:radical SAM family heme chaperone HemW [Campylobacterota bacterium]
MLLYIHIPFCDSKCSYCAFNSYVDKFHLKEQYMSALKTQLIYELERFGAKEKSVETIFIGGGTPSTVPPQLYRPIFELLYPYLKEGIEITSEANPNSATFEWLSGMQELGINRISFGVQSFNSNKLKILNRAHTPDQAKNAVLNAAKVGYKDISLDLIYATLGDTKELLEHDINTAFTLPINHISAYALTIENGTAFENKPQMSSEELSLTSWIFETIEAKGFKQYEISNFGTYNSTHNLGYWKYKDYMGVGSGAVGKLGLERFYPQIVIEEYIQNPTDIRVEKLEDEDKRIEQIFLGFRSFIGVNSQILNAEELKHSEILVEENKLYKRDGVFYNDNYLLADEITLFISS